MAMASAGESGQLWVAAWASASLYVLAYGEHELAWGCLTQTRFSLRGSSSPSIIPLYILKEALIQCCCAFVLESSF